MPSISSDARFLGVDLKALWLELRQSWQQLNQSPMVSWLTPEPPVRLLQADGRQSVWRGSEGAGSAAAQSVGGTSFIAIELPQERVLQRSLNVPAAMSAADLARAIALEARTSSPFAMHDLVWGCRVHAFRRGICQVDMALASKRQVAQYLTEQADRFKAVAVPEIWVLSSHGLPLVLQGFGEGVRHAFAVRRRRLGYGLLALALALGMALAATPTLQLRARALEAVAQYEALAARVAPVVRQREQLLQSAEHMNALAELLTERMEPLRVLEKLTEVLPDDTALQSFRLQGTKVTLGGLTSNTASLLQLLGEQPGLREVRSPSAATRAGLSGKENFSIELNLDPALFGVPKAAAASLAALQEPALPAEAVLSPGSLQDAASVSLPVSAAISGATPAPVVSPPAVPVAPSAKPAAAASGRATFGGGAVFGGSPARPAGNAVPPASAPLPTTSSTPAAKAAP